MGAPSSPAPTLVPAPCPGGRPSARSLTRSAMPGPTAVPKWTAAQPGWRGAWEPRSGRPAACFSTRTTTAPTPLIPRRCLAPWMRWQRRKILSTVDLAAHPSSRRRRSLPSCWPGHVRAQTMPPEQPPAWRTVHSRPWRFPVSMTCWAADLRATRWTVRGPCPISRRCSTTTCNCSGCMRGGRSTQAPMTCAGSAPAQPGALPAGCARSSPCPEEHLPPHSMLTPWWTASAWRAEPTPGRGGKSTVF